MSVAIRFAFSLVIETSLDEIPKPGIEIFVGTLGVDMPAAITIADILKPLVISLIVVSKLTLGVSRLPIGELWTSLSARGSLSLTPLM
jgi:hypothetical protein